MTFSKAIGPTSRLSRRLTAGMFTVGGVAFISCAGCPSLIGGSGGAALDSFAAAMQKLPDANIQAKSILPADIGPQGSLFGVLLEDNTQGFILGSTDSTGNYTIDGVAWYDADFNLLFQEAIRTGGATIFTPTGDAIDLDVSTSMPRITMALNSSSPRSIIVMDVQGDGTPVVNESASGVKLTENTGYGAAAKLKSGGMTWGKLAGLQTQESSTCQTISTILVWGTQLACDVKTQITAGMPIHAIEASCLLATTFLDTAAATSFASGSSTQKTLAALKASVLALCEVGKAAVGVGNVLTKFNPLDGACILLSLYAAGRTMKTGESLADQLCTMFTSDQVLPGVVTSDYLLRLTVLDYASEDGDMISIRLRQQEYFRGVVKNAPQAVTINLYPGFNHFEFEALNEGSDPPNTARVIIQSLEGTNLGLTSYDLNKGQIATLDIIRK